jgi:hypothetical protein
MPRRELPKKRAEPERARCICLHLGRDGDSKGRLLRLARWNERRKSFAETAWTSKNVDDWNGHDLGTETMKKRAKALSARMA